MTLEDTLDLEILRVLCQDGRKSFRSLAEELGKSPATIKKHIEVLEQAGVIKDYGIQISTGPVVPFRFDDLIADESTPKNTLVPLIWMSNIKPMRVEWPLETNKPQYIEMNNGTKPLIPNGRYILLRRFISKDLRSRLVSAIMPDNLLDFQYIGIENHVNILHSQWSSLNHNLALGLNLLLNSKFVSRYFHIINGTTQVNAYDLGLLPLPGKKVITNLSKLSDSYNFDTNSTNQLDELVLDILFHN